MIKLFSLKKVLAFRWNPTMMPRNHLLKTNYVFPHEWLIVGSEISELIDDLQPTFYFYKERALAKSQAEERIIRSCNEGAT